MYLILNQFYKKNISDGNTFGYIKGTSQAETLKAQNCPAGMIKKIWFLNYFQRLQDTKKLNW